MKANKILLAGAAAAALAATATTAPAPAGAQLVKLKAATFDTAMAYAGSLEEALKPSGSSLSFRADLLQMARRLAGSGEALGVADAPGADDANSGWFIPWVTGRYTAFSDGSTVDRDGGLWTINAGLTLRLNKDLYAGAFGRYRQGNVSSTALSADLDSRFWGGGAFVQLGGGDDLTAFTDYLQAGSPVAPPATDRIVELP